MREIHKKRRRRRSFHTIDYRSLLKSVKREISGKEDDNIIIHHDLYNRIDNVWMLSHVVRLPDIPMRASFNSDVTKDEQLISHSNQWISNSSHSSFSNNGALYEN